MNHISDKAHVFDGPEAVTASMQRMMQMQEERDKQIKLLQERFQAALAQERTRSQARFREQWQILQRYKSQRIMSLLSSMEERQRLEARIKEVVQEIAMRMKELEAVLKEGFRGRTTEAQSSLAEQQQHPQRPRRFSFEFCRMCRRMLAILMHVW